MDIERGIMVDKKKTVIGVVGIGHETGTTLVASGLAVVLAKGEGGAAYVYEGNGYKSGYLEQFKPFDQLSLQEIFGAKKMYDLYALQSEGISIEGRANIYNRVNWIVNVPKEYRKPLKHQSKVYKKTGEQTLPYHMLGCKTIVVDTPKDMHKMDKLVCVIDPLPSKIKSGIDVFAAIKEMEKTGPKTRVIWVINKFNPCVNQKQLERFLQIKADCVLDMIQPDIFYFAEYAGALPISIIEGKKLSERCRSFSDGLYELVKKVADGVNY